MPATRNIPTRRSRRLSHQAPPSYNEDGWEAFPTDDSSDDSWSPSPEVVLQHPSMSPVSPLVSEVDSAETSLTSESNTPPRRLSHTKRRGSDHIPRPPNAFMMYRSWYCAQIKNNPNAEKNHAVISCSAAQAWKLLPDNEKRIFQAQAHAKKAEHLLLYPDYKYAPNCRSKNPPPKRKQSKNDDDEERRNRVAAYVQLGIVGDDLANVMKDIKLSSTDSQSSKSTRHHRSQSPSPPAEPALHIKAESPATYPVLSLPYLPTNTFARLEDISPLDLNSEVQFEPMLVPDLPTPNPKIAISGFKSLLHPQASNTMLPQLDDTFASESTTLGYISTVDTYFDYDAPTPALSGCSSILSGSTLTFPSTFGTPKPKTREAEDASALSREFFDRYEDHLLGDFSIELELFRPTPEPMQALEMDFGDWLNPDPSLYQ